MENEKGERERERDGKRERKRGVNTIGALFYALTRINCLPVS